MMRNVRIVVLILGSLLLASCIETKNVTAFASSVTVVTDATTRLVQADRANCEAINATVEEVAALPGIESMGSANCDELGKVLAAIVRLNLLLGNYGKALGDVAQDNFVDYDSDVATLTGILKSLPAGAQPTPDRITAISGLAGWVASLVTERDREQAIRDAMSGSNGKMQANFHVTVDVLRKLVTQYQEGLSINLQIARTTVGLVRNKFEKTEPVAFVEFKRRLDQSSAISEDQNDAIKKYLISLDVMEKAFDAALKSPNAKEYLPEVRDFAKQARAVYQSVQKAYPGI